MYKKILVAYEGSNGSKKCLEFALSIAKNYKSELSALWIGGYKAYYHETAAEIEEENNAVSQFADKLRAEIKKISKQESYPINFCFLRGNPAKLILEYSEKNKIDLIVIGGKGYSGLWGNEIGHVTNKVCEKAKCNVLVIK